MIRTKFYGIIHVLTNVAFIIDTDPTGFDDIIKELGCFYIIGEWYAMA